MLAHFCQLERDENGALTEGEFTRLITARTAHSLGHPTISCSELFHFFSRRSEQISFGCYVRGLALLSAHHEPQQVIALAFQLLAAGGGGQVTKARLQQYLQDVGDKQDRRLFSAALEQTPNVTFELIDFLELSCGEEGVTPLGALVSVAQEMATLLVHVA